MHFLNVKRRGEYLSHSVMLAGIVTMFCLMSLVCGAVLTYPAQPGNYEFELQVEGVKRDFRLHLPPGYDGCTPMPVILAFHGMSANAKLLQKAVELDRSADKHGYITVYPNGTGVGPLKGFKAGASTGNREDRKPNDVRFTHAILDKLERTFCIDDQRIYATGLSNGAMMCYRLAVEMPHRIAAIAPVSGALGRGVCKPTQPISVMHFHGTCDNVLPFAGPHEKGLFAQNYHPVRCTHQFFADAACCDQETEEALPNRFNDGTTVVVHTSRNSETGAEIVLVEIQGGGHQWPQQPIRLKYLGEATEEVDANEMMCCFFSRHTLASAGYILDSVNDR